MPSVEHKASLSSNDKASLSSNDKASSPSTRASTELSRMSSGQALSFKEKAARLVGVGLVASAGALPDIKPVQATDIQKHIDSPNKIEQFEKQEMPSANALIEAGFQIGGSKQELASQGVPSSSLSDLGVEDLRGYEAESSFVKTTEDKIEASQTITETLQNLLVTREWLEQNPQTVKGSTKTTVDADGNVTAFFTLHGNKYIYKSERNANNRLEKYQAILQDEVPMENPRDIAVSPDGRIRLAVGEDPIRSGVFKGVISYDNGPWKVLSGWLPGVGHYAELITNTVDNKSVFIFSTLSPENQRGKHVLTADPQTQTEQRIATDSNGSTFGIMSPEIKNPTKEIELVTFRFGTSGFWLEKINWETGATTIEYIDTVTVNRVSINLGTCLGAGRYIDLANGHRHIVTSQLDRNVRYDIDIDSPTKTATEKYYANWFDNHGIANYAPGSLLISGFQIRQDSQGILREWFFGSYISTIDSLQRAVAGSYPLEIDPSQKPNLINAYDLFPNKQSAVGQGKTIKINNQLAFDITISFTRGKILLTEDGNVFYTVNGFGDNPLEPTPTPTPERPFKVYIPAAFKNLITSSWRKVKETLRRARSKQ